jgi:hypothetical protein
MVAPADQPGMSSKVFGTAAPGITDIGTAYYTLIQTLGAAAATVFMIALLNIVSIKMLLF